MTQARTQLTLLAGFFLFLVTAIALLNVCMDPYYIFNRTIKRRPYDLGDKSYLTKAVALTHQKPDTLIIGTSVVDSGFNIEGSMNVFHDDDFHLKSKKLTSNLQTSSIYNAGIRGGSLYDIFNYIKHAHKNNPNLKHIILGVEWGVFTDARPPTPAVPKVSVLGHRHISPKLYLENAFTLESTYDAYRTLALNHKLVHNLSRIGEKLLTPATQSHQVIPSKEEAIRLFSEHSLTAAANGFKQHGAKSLLNADSFNMMRKITQFCREKNIELDVYVSPQHRIYWQTVKKSNLDKYAAIWLRTLASITPFWDFSKKIDFAANANDYFESDALHFNTKAGDAILPAILSKNKQHDPNITLVNKSNVEQSIRLRQKLMRQTHAI